MIKKILMALLISSSAYATTPVIQLTTANSYTFRGVVDDMTVIQAQLELAKLDAIRGNSNYTIYLIMDSPGGSISDGEAFIQFAKHIKNLKTIALDAASMASAIVEALPGERYATTSSRLMFHRAKGGFQGQFETGEVESRLAMAKAMVQSLEQRNADRLKLSLAEYKNKVVNELWAYGSDAVTQNMVDAIVDIKCSKELIDQKVASYQATFFGSRKVVYSGCPLLRVELPVEKDDADEDSNAWRKK